MAYNPYNDPNSSVDSRFRGRPAREIIDYTPTSAQEQHDLDGYTRTSRPVGNDGPTCYPPAPNSASLGGTAGDDDVAATHPAYQSQA